MSLFRPMIPTKNVSRFPKTCNTRRQTTRATSHQNDGLPEHRPLEQEFSTSLESEFRENTNSKSTRRKHAWGGSFGSGKRRDERRERRERLRFNLSRVSASRSLALLRVSLVVSFADARVLVGARLNRLPPCGTGPRRPLQAEEGRPRRRRRRPLRWKARA